MDCILEEGDAIYPPKMVALCLISHHKFISELSVERTGEFNTLIFAMSCRHYYAKILAQRLEVPDWLVYLSSPSPSLMSVS